MRVRAALASLALIAAAACTFSSERPLFTERSGAHPFSHDARFTWREDGGGDLFTVIYRRVGARYEVAAEEDEGERPISVLFIAVPQTPEDDYIAQVAIEPGAQERAYAFLYPIAGGHRIVSAPSIVDDHAAGQAALQRRCRTRPNGECQFASGRDVIAFYREAIYPIFVRGVATPHDYIDQTPIGASSPLEGK